MKVRNALICLDCDEIYPSERDDCPRCMNTRSVKVSTYIPPLHDSIKEEKVARKGTK